MSWLRGLVSGEEGGTKKKRHRNPNKTAAEKMENEKAAYIKWIKKHNRPLYDKVMQELCGLREEKAKDNLAVTLDTVKQLRGSGFFPKDPRDLDDDNADFKKEVVQIGALLLQGMMQSRPPIVVPQQAEALPPAQQQTMQAISERVGSQPMKEDHKMGLIEGMIKKQLEDKAPDEAAQWLLAQTHPAAKQIVQTFCEAPDDNLPQLLSEFSEQAPDFAGLIAWLRTRQPWLVQTVRALRKLGGYPQPSAMGL
jgi:hypothetical protein